MPLEVWTTKIRTCAAVLKCMLIQLGSSRSLIALLPGLMGPRAKAEKKKPSETTSVACRKREVQDARSSFWMLNQRLLQRWREREREGERRRAVQ
ncbi:hypothetical protein QQF64_017535 [Cirrhinus molitorella]|uniref:Uncharacterized protein n=1 Tax=Cirrhinus molitorella TaxID=172907 RepID=A0ABR3LIX4_9TELE